jgi:type VI secretion system secreted protein VgrG
MDENRFVSVHGDGAAGLNLFRMQGHESLGQLFEYNLELVSADANLDLASVVGKAMTVQSELPGGDFRYFNGIVSQFKIAGASGTFARYAAVLRPRLWLLKRTSSSRIFQHKTVPEVVMQVFRDRGVDFEDRLGSDYRAWEYLVQYRESDLNFINRILEYEGIYYYFKHDDGRHTVILADEAGAHEAFPGYGTIPYFPVGQQRRTKDNISVWSASRQLVSGAYAAKDFNFEAPKLNAFARLSASTGTAHDDLEVYHYPGIFRDKGGSGKAGPRSVGGAAGRL